MNFGELLWKLKERATEFILFIWSQDYSALDTKIWGIGISLLDVIGILLGVMILWEILKWFATLTGKMLTVISQLLLYLTFTVLLLVLKKILSRALSTAQYIWLSDKVRVFRQTIYLHLQDRFLPRSKA